MKKIFYTLFAAVMIASCANPTPNYNNLSKDDFELEILSNLDSTKVTTQMIIDVIRDVEFIYETEEYVNSIRARYDTLSYDDRILVYGSKEHLEYCDTRKTLDAIRDEYMNIKFRYEDLREFFTPTFKYMMFNRLEKARSNYAKVYYMRFTVID